MCLLLAAALGLRLSSRLRQPVFQHTAADDASHASRTAEHASIHHVCATADGAAASVLPLMPLVPAAARSQPLPSGNDAVTWPATAGTVQLPAKQPDTVGSPPGIGIIVESDPDVNGNFAIQTVVRGSPAELTGRVHENDVVEMVDGALVRGCTSAQLRERVTKNALRGTVDLSLRKGSDGRWWKQGDVVQVHIAVPATFIEYNLREHQPKKPGPSRRLPFSAAATLDAPPRDCTFVEEELFNGAELVTDGRHSARPHLAAATQQSLNTAGQAKLLPDRTGLAHNPCPEVAAQVHQDLERLDVSIRHQIRQDKDVVAEQQEMMQPRALPISAGADREAEAPINCSPDDEQKAREAEIRFLQEEHEKSMHAALQQACSAIEASHEEERKMWREEREKEWSWASQEQEAERRRFEAVLEKERAVIQSTLQIEIIMPIREC